MYIYEYVYVYIYVSIFLIYVDVIILFLSLHIFESSCHELIVIYSVLYNVGEERVYTCKCKILLFASGKTNIAIKSRVMCEKSCNFNIFVSREFL